MSTLRKTPAHAAATSIILCGIPKGEPVNLLSTIPILRIFSVDKAYEFYRDFLGFTVAWEHRYEPALPLYASVKRGNIELHLSEHHGDASPGSTVFIPMQGIDELCRELNDKAYGYARPGIEEAGHGRTMQIADPFGNRLRFCELAP